MFCVMCVCVCVSNAAQNSGNFKDALKRAQHCLNLVEGTTEAMLPKKVNFTAQLYSCMGNAYMEMGQYDLALAHHHKDYTTGERE